MLLVGLDPGTETGVAQWSTAGKVLGMVESMAIHRAMALVYGLPQRAAGELLVIFEDARQHRIYVPAHQRNDAALQGVGSVKRDCAIWEDFLTDHSIPFITRKPSSRRTKRTTEEFRAITGWTARTNNHGRDAAMLIAGVNESMARAWLAEAKQRVAA